ncbi:MAG TPA: radical SAM protein [Kofleriaceae bacterium]
MKSRATDNPPNRFRDVVVTYDDGDGPPPATITLLEDQSRSILSHNDSPDLGFNWSANPYRGCQSACAYCSHGDTEVLLSSGMSCQIADIRVGDEIVGTSFDGVAHRYVKTRVLDQWSTRKPAYRMRLADATELIASADHRFLAPTGWVHVADVAPATSLVGLDLFADAERTIERRVVSIDTVGEQPLYDITTGTGDFIANGVVSHNCYARPTHEYLDLGAGTDFDTKIVIKPTAPELLREAFDKPSWKGELVMFSGVTDCYQPIERDLQLTKQCLEVCLEYRNPVSIISKHALVERDVDLIAELAREAGAHLSVSLAWIDAELARTIEPWAASPQRRLKVIETFAKAGVPVGVMMAPIIPGLNDNQMVKVLEAARAAGAQWAGWTLLRLPGAVKEVFEDRLRVSLPLVADRVMHRVRETRGGEKLYDATFGTRGRGVGVYAETIKALFDTTVKRLGFNQDDWPDPPSRFQRPNRSNQLSLF